MQLSVRVNVNVRVCVCERVRLPLAKMIAEERKRLQVHRLLRPRQNAETIHHRRRQKLHHGAGMSTPCGRAAWM